MYTIACDREERYEPIEYKISDKKHGLKWPSFWDNIGFVFYDTVSSHVSDFHYFPKSRFYEILPLGNIEESRYGPKKYITNKMQIIRELEVEEFFKYYNINEGGYYCGMTMLMKAIISYGEDFKTIRRLTAIPNIDLWKQDNCGFTAITYLYNKTTRENWRV